MRIEIGSSIKVSEMLEVIKNNMDGTFVVENGKIYLDNVIAPKLTNLPQQYQQPMPPQHYPPQYAYAVKPKSNPFSDMGDKLNEVMGIR